MASPEVRGPLHPAGEPGTLPHELLGQVLSGSAAGIGVVDTELRYLYVNPALARMNGVPPADHLGRTMREVLPGVDSQDDVLRQVLADGLPRETTSSGQTRAASGLDRRYWHGTYHRLDVDGRPYAVVGIVLEVSASRREQRALERARERLALLDTAATRIGTTLEIDTTCGELAEFLVPVLADVATVEVFPPDRSEAAGRIDADSPLRLRRAALAAVARLLPQARRLGVPGDHLDFQPGSQILRSMASGRPAVLNLPSDARLARAAPDVQRVGLYRALGLHSAVVIPLTARGTALGALTMARGDRSPAFTEQDVVIARDLAVRAAISLDNARRYTREHDMALELQKSLLSEPSTPQPGTEVAARYLPAGSSALVGGDWYDTIRRPLGRTLLVMGDVMGHGVEAAVDMSTYRSMLRVAGRADLPPHQVLYRMDEMISEHPDSRPVTCLLALADPVRGRLCCAGAGHLPPVVLRAGGPAEVLPVPPGPPLGTGVGGYESITVPWEPGDVLLLYTDGLVERRGEDVDVSLERLRDLRFPSDLPLDEFVDRVLRETAPSAAEDDVAVLAARFLPRPPVTAAGPPLAPHPT